MRGPSHRRSAGRGRLRTAGISATRWSGCGRWRWSTERCHRTGSADRHRGACLLFTRGRQPDTQRKRAPARSAFGPIGVSKLEGHDSVRSWPSVCSTISRCRTDPRGGAPPGPSGPGGAVRPGRGRMRPHGGAKGSTSLTRSTPRCVAGWQPRDVSEDSHHHGVAESRPRNRTGTLHARFNDAAAAGRPGAGGSPGPSQPGEHPFTDAVWVPPRSRRPRLATSRPRRPRTTAESATSRSCGNAPPQPRREDPGRPNSRSLAGVSATSRHVPSRLISRHCR